MQHSLDPVAWFEIALEGILGDRPNPPLLCWESQERARLMVIKGLLMAGMQNADDAVITALCKDESNPYAQAWAQEEWSRRAAKRARATTRNACDAEEAAALLQASAPSPLDTQDIGWLLLQGARMEVLQRQARRQSVPKLRQQLVSRITRFCRYARHKAAHSDFYDAGDALWRYSQGQITDQELGDIINTHLTKLYDDGIAAGARPGLVLVTVTDGRVSPDDGGAYSAMA